MRYRFVTADVFTSELFGGNQLAVFPDAKGLSPETMQAVARELNLSETVFVHPPDEPHHTRRLRIFTPGVELPFAGHPTVGAAYVLGHIGEIPLDGERTQIVFEEGVGPIPVEISAENGKPVAATLSAAQMPEFGEHPPDDSAVAAVLSLSADDIRSDEWRPATVSCGVPFLFVPLRSREALARATIDVLTWRQVLENSWAPHVYAFCHEPELAGSQLRARMFAPAMGITEDPATGAAATAFAGYLAAHEEKGSSTLRWVVEQGFEMGRPSVIEVEADRVDGEVSAIRVSGSSVIVSSGEMEIPERFLSE